MVGGKMKLEIYDNSVILEDEFYMNLSFVEADGILAYLKLLKAAQAMKEILK